MIHRVRAEAILDRWAIIIERAGAHHDRYLDAVVRRFRRSQLQNVAVAPRVVRLGSWRARPLAAVVFLQRSNPDLRCYVSVRSLGVHLEVLRLIALEPWVLKRRLAVLLCKGAWWAWSAPRDLSQDSDVQSFVTVVDVCVEGAAKALAGRIGGHGNLLEGGPRDVLEEWQ